MASSAMEMLGGQTEALRFSSLGRWSQCLPKRWKSLWRSCEHISAGCTLGSLGTASVVVAVQSAGEAEKTHSGCYRVLFPGCPSCPPQNTWAWLLALAWGCIHTEYSHVIRQTWCHLQRSHRVPCPWQFEARVSETQSCVLTSLLS